MHTPYWRHFDSIIDPPDYNPDYAGWTGCLSWTWPRGNSAEFLRLENNTFTIIMVTKQLFVNASDKEITFIQVDPEKSLL